MAVHRPGTNLPPEARGDATQAPQRRSLQGGQSARSLLLTVLGEYVLPRSGAVWTSTLLGALALLGVEDKAGRQALARAAKAGWLVGERRGRAARWHLTDRGRALLAEGTERIYAFDPGRRGWDGKWLLLVISVPEDRRAERHVLRTGLAWSGFGSLGQGVWLSPDTARQTEIEPLFAGLRRPTRAVTFVAELGTIGDAAALVHQAWDLSELEARYLAFVAEFAKQGHESDAVAFVIKTRLVHEWRKFPFIDPGLPTDLLPPGWPGREAHFLFHHLHRELSRTAEAWFDETEQQGANRNNHRGDIEGSARP